MNVVVSRCRYGDKAKCVAALAVEQVSIGAATDSGGAGAVGPLARPLATGTYVFACGKIVRDQVAHATPFCCWFIGFPFIEAEVVFAVRHEYAQTACDVRARRTRLAMRHREAALRALPRVVELMGGELNWGAARRASEMRNACVLLGTMGASDGADADAATERAAHEIYRAL